MSDNACEVPLVEKLRSVPKDLVIIFREGSPLFGSRSISVGVVCHYSADWIDQLRKLLKDQVDASTSWQHRAQAAEAKLWRIEHPIEK